MGNLFEEADTKSSRWVGIWCALWGRGVLIWDCWVGFGWLAEICVDESWDGGITSWFELVETGEALLSIGSVWGVTFVESSKE